MMSDTVDYGEWCNGKRLTGISFAGTLFVLKLSYPRRGRALDWLMLAGGGYDAAAKTQNSATISIIIACSPSFRPSVESAGAPRSLNATTP